MNRTTNVENLRRSLKTRRGLTPKGATWLSQSLDIYPDNLKPCVGYPDIDNSYSYVSVRNVERTFTTPGAGAWDLQVFTLPKMNVSNFVDGNQNGHTAPFIVDANTTTYGLGTINYATSDAGVGLFPDSPLTLANFAMGNITTANSDECSRIVGIGFEVIDQSAVLHQQGALTVYNYPVSTQSTLVGCYNDVANTLAIQTLGPLYGGWAATPGEAIVLNNSKTWAAKDGAYVNVGLSGIENPFMTYERLSTKIFAKGATMTGDCLHSEMTAYAVGTNVAPLLTAGSSFLDSRVPIPVVGCYLAGLNEDASILVRTRLIVETAVRPNNAIIVSGASPSPGYDPRAFELYSQIRSALPVGVPVGENDSGDWLRRVMGLINYFSPIISRAMPALGLGIEAGKMAYNIIQQRQPKKLPARTRAVQQIKVTPVKPIRSRRQRKAAMLKVE